MKLDDRTYVLSIPRNLGGEDDLFHPILILDETAGHTLVDTGLLGQEGDEVAELCERVSDEEHGS